MGILLPGGPRWPNQEIRSMNIVFSTRWMHHYFLNDSAKEALLDLHTSHVEVQLTVDDDQRKHPYIFVSTYSLEHWQVKKTMRSQHYLPLTELEEMDDSPCSILYVLPDDIVIQASFCIVLDRIRRRTAIQPTCIVDDDCLWAVSCYAILPDSVESYCYLVQTESIDRSIFDQIDCTLTFCFSWLNCSFVRIRSF